MLIEAKVKVAKTIDGKVRKRTETVIVDKEFYSEAEYKITEFYSNDSSVEDFSILSLKQSPVKEIATQFDGTDTFIATLKDIWLDDDGNEKALRYKVLLWADDLTQANSNALQLSKQGYDMQIESIKQVDYEYFPLIEQ